MITPQQLANHLAMFTCPVDGSAMASAVRASEVGGGHDVIRWKSASGYTGVTHIGLGQVGQGKFGVVGSQ